MMRTYTCGAVSKNLGGQSITLCGWVRARRHHGGIIFIDLWDREGQMQVVCHPDEPVVFQQAEQLHAEYVVQVTGLVQARPVGTENEELTSGDVELIAKNLLILNSAQPLPFSLDEHTPVSEEVALKHRPLYLRRAQPQARFKLRSQANSLIRRSLEDQGFLEIETPMLTRATPEGARDYLVPSRTHPGKYFALPQSPQLFKQLFMMAGFDRYYQIVRCFRDEDLRADRQPEFTQLDMEMAFVEEQDVQVVAEQLIRHLFWTLLQVKLADPFPVMRYAQALRDYGSDKPDLRIPLKMIDIADLVRSVGFQVFAAAAQDPAARVVALRLPGGAHLSRRALDEYTQYVTQRGAKGLAWLKLTAEGVQSPIAKFLPTEILTAILTRTHAETGDILFFGADQATLVNTTLGALRLKLGQDHALITTAWSPVWIVDFPLLEWDETEQRWQALHHPFTAPQNGDLSDPARCLARAYDLVLNGVELGGGSIRIHDALVQSRLFDLLGIQAEEAQEKFGFLLDAMKLGCPPHGGIALGLDRLIMLMSGAQSIREVIAFPKTQTAHCPLTDAPATIDPTS